MDNLFQTSLFAGVTVSLVAYLLGMLLKKKFKLAIPIARTGRRRRLGWTPDS